MKSNHKNFVRLVGLYTYCRMMHGVYNVKKNHLYVLKLQNDWSVRNLKLVFVKF